LPPKLRASNLILEEETRKAELNGFDNFRDDEHSYSIQHNDSSFRSATSDPGERSSEDTTSPPSTNADVVRSQSADDNAKIAHAMQLLLAARERVLTLSEQRILSPMIPQLTSPPMITSLDLSPLISHNPTLAHPLFVALLTSSSISDSNPASTQSPGLSTWIEVLPHLPPTLPTFDLLGHLLRDYTLIGNTTVADLVRSEVLGRFIHESINWLDHAEQEEREGLISDDRFPKGVQNLCRFYNSLIKLSIVDPTSDADSAEMAHFSLRNARFEEAQKCWVALAMGKL